MAKELGIGIIGGAINAATQNSRERRSMRNQRELMDIQYKNQEGLNRQGQALQLDTWKKTNYPAQMKMMREAGLNPGLMYGQAGAGGTTGGQGGGAAGSGSAPAPQQLDIKGGVSAAIAASQIELAKSQSEKNKAETSSIRGEQGTTGAAQQSLMGSQKNVQDVQYDKVIEEVNIIAIDRNIAQRTREEKIKQITNEAIYSQIKIEAEKANIKLTEQQENALWHKIRQEWVKAGLQGLGMIVKGGFRDIIKGGAKGKGTGKGTSPLSEAAKKALSK